MPDRGDLTLVRAEGLAAGYGATPVLTDVAFALHAGERMGVLGPNGGGKTTLFRVLLGELTPLAGTLQAPARFAVVPQTERSRLDFPVSALDVALMGALSRLPWWRRPGRPERDAARAALIRRERVKAVFPESSINAKLAQAIARQTGATSRYRLYGDTLGPAGSSGATYLSMERANADAMVRGFTAGARGCPITGI